MHSRFCREFRRRNEADLGFVGWSEGDSCLGVRWEWGIGVEGFGEFWSKSWMNDCVEETVNPAGSSSSFGQQGQQSRKD